jgi:legumain
MPTLPYLFADDVVDTLKAKHAARGFKELVFYLEACESGSIFEGLLPESIHVYATTASNAMESSWGTYCPGMYPEPPMEYETCLGDLYSVAWMEDSDMHNLNKETLKLQYELVKERTSNHHTYESGSHVMQYGTVTINSEPVSFFTGSDPANEGAPEPAWPQASGPLLAGDQAVRHGVINQRDADMLHLWHKYKNAAEGSPRKIKALEEMSRVAAERAEIDRSVALITKLLSSALMVTPPRQAGQPLVDDWKCLKGMIRAFEAQCGHLTQYGMKHTRTFANACNAGVSVEVVASAAADACAESTRHLAVNGIFSA